MNVKLGKKEYAHDPRTLSLGAFMRVLKYPPKFVFDAGRAPFPEKMYGNDQYGDCVFADRANAQIRLERVEQRRTIQIADADVVRLYKRLTGCQNPGDANDQGFVMLDAMKQWKNEGWNLISNLQKTYKIAAYGEIDAVNLDEIKASIYMLGGVHFGFALPWAAASMTDTWHYNGETGPDWQPGSWGGHAVYGFGYDADSVFIKTWGQTVRVTNNFIRKYCDEGWAVVDSLDSWRTVQTINVPALTNALHQISNRVG